MHGRSVTVQVLTSQRANILKEVQIMRGIDHDSIVKLLGFFESEEHYFLILEREWPQAGFR